MHGFNRLGGNSVAETVVAGMIVGEYIADFCDSSAGDINVSTALIRQCYTAQENHLGDLCAGQGTESAFDLMRQMQQTMTDNVGIFRHGERLQEAVSTLQSLLVRSRNIAIGSQLRGANPELVTAYRVQKMLKLSLCVAAGALQRTESRGAHYRQDFPLRNDRDWLKRTLATWAGADETLPQLSYEELSVQAMELPPGWRGYGDKNHIDHPATAERQAEVEAIEHAHAGTDRFALQEALMPYRDCLPPGLRGRNARLGESD
jgi:fumarate reductase flavoprotein subunit